MNTLFPPLPFPLCTALKGLYRHLNQVQPLKTAHKRDLPLAVEELSLRLTSERSALNRPYWSSPRLTSAYLRYFMPWNLVRLARLFSGLPLPPPTPLPQSEGPLVTEGESPAPLPLLPRLLVDVGSGPLTVPIALWLAKASWRELPLTVLCLDTAPQALELGKKLFFALAGEHSPWRIVTRRAPLEGMLREVRHSPGVPWLLTGANVINEIPVKAGQYNDERFAAIAAMAAQFCHNPGASALFVEPGTRLGGKNMTSLREQALEAGLRPVAPCPHARACPVQDGNSWCHFTFDTEGAPDWLQDLSRQAHLNKEGLSMSFMLLQEDPQGDTGGQDDSSPLRPDLLPDLLPDVLYEALQQDDPEHERPRRARPAPSTTLGAPQAHIEKVRIISAPFTIPGMWGSARYACSEQGLALITDALHLTSGSLVEAQWPDDPQKDKKSGAFILAPHKVRGEVIHRSVPHNPRPHSPRPHNPRPQRPAPKR